MFVQKVYRYKIVKRQYNIEDQEVELSRLGEDGWELVSVVKHIDLFLLYLKKRVEV